MKSKNSISTNVISKKQLMANQKNSQNSTGPKTDEGKTAVSTNAVKHGIFSNRIILNNECKAEYHDLLTELVESLKPEGKLEELLTEKIVTAMWRQLRFTKAETAHIQTRTCLNNPNMRSKVGRASNYDGVLSPSINDFNKLNEEELVQIEWCKTTIDEIDSMTSIYTATLNEIKQLPNTMNQLKQDAKEGQETPQNYLASYKGINEFNSGSNGFLDELKTWCQNKLSKLESRQRLIELMPVVQDRESLPITNQLLTRYQVTLDNELYKALKALREQQEWRLRAKAS